MISRFLWPVWQGFGIFVFMDAVLKWKCVAGAASAVAVAGWTLYAMEEPPGVPTLAGGSIPKKADVARSAAGGATGGSSGTLVKDARTEHLLASLADSTGDAKPGQVSHRFLQAVDQTLLDSNFERRRRNFGLIMEHLRPEDAPELHKAFVKLHGEGRPFEEYSIFASRWGEVDGAGAIAFLRSTGIPIEPRDFDEIMKGWGQSNPGTAMQFLTENAAFASSYQGEAAVLRGWARQDPEAATKWITSHSEVEPGRLQQSLGAVLLEQLYGQGLEKTGEWLAALPDAAPFSEASRAAWHMNLHRFEALRPEEAATLWKSVGEQPWMQFQDFRRFVQIAGPTPDRNEAMLTALATSEPGTVARQFQRWATTDPTTTSEWLADSLACPAAFRQEAIRGLVAALQQEDPAAAAEWQRQLSAP